VNDAGAGLLGGLTNSQCTINSFNASGSGNTLTLTMSITFSGSFAGNKVVYLAARDTAENNSGWQQLGVWQVPGSGVPAMSMSPASGTGRTQSFTFTFNQTNLGVVNVLVNDYLNGNHACYLAYSRPANALYLVNDNGTGLLAGLSNSQCTVNSFAGTYNGTTLTLNMNVSFAAAFSGPRIFYLAARDVNEQNNTGWQTMGAWLVP